MNDPSTAELVRRIEDLVKAVEQLTSTMRETYATKEAVKRVEDLHGAEITELKKDNDARAATQRQIVAGLVIGFVMLLVPLIGAIQQVVGGAP